jgi:hypothetical protein
MSRDLAAFQAAFAGALFEPPDAAPGPLAALTAQPAFAVYRNTVMKGCVDALEANFPSVARLVGNDWLRAAAALYAAAQPPADARLLRYGEGFADFLGAFEPARELPYLADVARLDRCWTEAHAAADAPADAAFLGTLSPDALGATRVAPHPAARWRWFADQPIFSIWSRNRTECAGDGDGDIAWQGEGALLTRRDGVVAWRAASQADCTFLDACAAGALLVDAAEAALQVQPDVDLAGLLAGLLRADALIVSSTVNPGAMP